MEVVFEELEGPPQVPLPAVGIAREEKVEAAAPGLGEHRRHRRRAPDRSAAVCDLERQARVHESVTLNEAVLLLALAGRPEAVVLAGSGLPDPARDPQAADLVERPRQTVYAAGSLRRFDIRVMFDRPSTPPRRISSGPSG